MVEVSAELGKLSKQMLTLSPSRAGIEQVLASMVFVRYDVRKKT